jgi:hypothetical protein
MWVLFLPDTNTDGTDSSYGTPAIRICRELMISSGILCQYHKATRFYPAWVKPQGFFSRVLNQPFLEGQGCLSLFIRRGKNDTYMAQDID